MTAMNATRRIMLYAAMVTVPLGPGCIDTATRLCPNGLRCLPGHTCAQTETNWVCVAGGCGDGIVSGDEVCDDGNRMSGDGCRHDCRSDETCGNGVLDPDEQCDDGNQVDDDACVAECKAAVCGDGFVNAPTEQCDDGNDDIDDDCGYCEPSHCLDGQKNRGEYGVDCGGTCRTPCRDGESCQQGYDCYSGVCTDERCDGRQLSTGGYHTCLLSNQGDVRCWGQNEYGQLGRGHEENIGDDECPVESVDIPPGEGGDVVQITAGDAHTCALRSGGEVWCWGSNDYGQLGLGHTKDIGDDEGLETSPVRVGDRVIQITAGRYHTCALLRTGYARCWGGNYDGQLGLGSNDEDIGDDEDPSVSDLVHLGSVRVLRIEARGEHTCSLLQRGQEREVACWGQNDTGQLGLGHTNDIGDDELPGERVNIESSVVQLSSSYAHVCVRFEGGDIKCWGRNHVGQLGQGNVRAIGDDDVPAAERSVDLGGSQALQISAGGFHTCVLVDQGSVRCWGENDAGQLGYGNTLPVGHDSSHLPLTRNVAIGDGRLAVQVETGQQFTCVLLDDDTTRCWGINDSGQLGYGHTERIGDDETPPEVHPCQSSGN